MNFGIKFRLVLLGSALVLVGALLVMITVVSQRHAGELRVRLGQIDSESFGIADRFKDTLREVNDEMFHYGAFHDPAAWDEFLKRSQELNVWIDEQKPRLNTQREKDILQQIDTAYDDYLSVARNLHAQMQSAGQSSATLAEFVPLRSQSQHLFDLGQLLAKAHYESRNNLLSHAKGSLSQLRLSILVLLGLLFIFGGALAFGVYRHLIAPLRVKLGASQALAERHEKLASLGMLAAGVAHEIRNPLTAVKAALFIQQKKFQPTSPEYADVKLVEREILRLERIVNDFLQFARPSEPDLATVPADLLLLEMQQFLGPQLAKTNIQLALETSAPRWVRVDAAQMKQVLINLVQNAADSIGTGGKITLRTRQERRRLRNGETDAVILEVADTGKGIPSGIEKRLFDPFFTTKENGIGLGLSIAARIVENHGGALQYQTQLNRGTTFGIVLPEASA